MARVRKDGLLPVLERDDRTVTHRYGLRVHDLGGTGVHAVVHREVRIHCGVLARDKDREHATHDGSHEFRIGVALQLLELFDDRCEQWQATALARPFDVSHDVQDVLPPHRLAENRNALIREHLLIGRPRYRPRCSVAP